MMKDYDGIPYFFYPDKTKNFTVANKADDGLASKIKETGKIIKTFELAYPGWECDGQGWVIEYEGKRYLILTDHGNEYIASKYELNEQIKLYKSLIKQAADAIKMLKKD